MRFAGTPAWVVALTPWVERHLPQINASPAKKYKIEKKEGGHKDS